jgi:hypothetical protein
MLPPVDLVLGVEMLRDGGSLCASFQGSNASVYWLILPIRMRTDAEGNHYPIGYRSPIIVERPFAPEEISISWEHATVMLGELERLLPADADRRWVNAMYVAISHKGDWLPPNLRRVISASLPEEASGA